MRINENGVYRDMTPEEIAELEEATRTREDDPATDSDFLAALRELGVKT